jgi:hypothetical protein
VLVWSPKPTKDMHNPDLELRDRSVVGIVLTWNLRYEDGQYETGTSITPRMGARTA